MPPPHKKLFPNIFFSKNYPGTPSKFGWGSWVENLKFIIIFCIYTLGSPIRNRESKRKSHWKTLVWPCAALLVPFFNSGMEVNWIWVVPLFKVRIPRHSKRSEQVKSERSDKICWDMLGQDLVDGTVPSTKELSSL